MEELELDPSPPTDGSTTDRRSSNVSALPTSTKRQVRSSANPVELAERLTRMWDRTMEAPLEKIATDDCSDQVFSLWHDLRDNIGLAGDDQILTALRVVATAFDLKPPVG